MYSKRTCGTIMMLSIFELQGLFMYSLEIGGNLSLRVCYYLVFVTLTALLSVSEELVFNYP